MSLQLPSTIWVATAPINLRLSFDRLAGIVRAELGGDPKQPLLVMFHNRRRTHAKLLWHDGYAYCLFYKRLERGRTFRIPLAIPPDAKSVVVDERELQLILRGLNHKLLRKADAIVAAIRAARKSGVAQSRLNFRRPNNHGRQMR
jgi:transposase